MKLIPKAGAAALLVAAAVAVPVVTVNLPDELPLDVGALVSELRGRGIELDEGSADFVEPIFFIDSLNGYEWTQEFSWREEVLTVTLFAGQGEALIGASRLGRWGDSITFPNQGGGTWTGVVGEVFGPRHWFVEGRLIVHYRGDDAQMLDALSEIKGAPFAGSGAGEDDEWASPEFRGLWRTIRIPVRNVVPDAVELDSGNYLNQVRFEAYEGFSFACSGWSTDDFEVSGNEIQFDLTVTFVNPDKVEMAEACEVSWSWEERKRLAPNLEAGRRYSVVINGEHLAQFVAQ